MRKITIDDLNAAIRGLHMNSAPIEDLRETISQGNINNTFAGAVIVAAAKHVLKSKQRVGLLRNPRRGNPSTRSGNRSEVRSPTSSRTEVRSPTSTRTATKASTKCIITVTGGAGRGATTSVTVRRNPAFKARGRGGRMVAKTATSINRRGNDQVVRYHNTDIAVLNDRGEVTLNSGGWLTTTTKRRMNEAFTNWQLPISIYQKRGDWFVLSQLSGQAIPFQDGMTLHPKSPMLTRTNPRTVLQRGKKFAVHVQLKPGSSMYRLATNGWLNVGIVNSKLAAIAKGKKWHKATGSAVKVTAA